MLFHLPWIGSLRGGVPVMEIERQLSKVERVSFKLYQVIGSVFGVLSLLALLLFGFAKLIQYLWLSW